MGKHVLAGLLIGVLPSFAFAGGWSNGFFGISLGFGGNNWFGGLSYNSYPGYGYGYGGYGGYWGYGGYYPAYRPYRYYAPAPPVVIHTEPAYIQPTPAVIVPRRSYTTYYETTPRTYAAPSGRYYYGR